MFDKLFNRDKIQVLQAQLSTEKNNHETTVELWNASREAYKQLDTVHDALYKEHQALKAASNSELAAVESSRRELQGQKESLQQDYDRILAEKNHLLNRVEDLKKEHFIPLESDYTILQAKYNALEREHHDCVKYDGHTVTEIIKQRNNALTELGHNPRGYRQ